MNIPESAREWLRSGERGISSETIFSTITGLELNQCGSHPLDPADFRRCSLLLDERRGFNVEVIDEHGLTPSDYYAGVTYPNG